MKRIPGHLSDSLELMTVGTAEDITNGLHIDLGQIQSIGISCREKVEEVVKYYDIVIKELNELTEATLQTKGVTEEARLKTMSAIKVNEDESKFLEEEQNRLNAENEKIKKQLDEETTEFKKVLSGMGGVKNMFCQLVAVAADTGANGV